MAGVALEGRIRMNAADDARMFPGAAGLLQKFPDAGCDRGGVGPVDAPSRDFPFRPARAVAELADQNQLLLRRQSQVRQVMNSCFAPVRRHSNCSAHNVITGEWKISRGCSKEIH